MPVSSELIRRFVKETNNKTKPTKNETNVYGQITDVRVNDDGSYIYYVLLDGSSTPIPVTKFTTTVNIEEQVIVMIKNHTPIITGNISSASVGVNQISKSVAAIPVATVKALWE